MNDRKPLNAEPPPSQTSRAGVSRFLIPFAALFCLWPGVSSAVALLLGVAIAVILGNPYVDRLKPTVPRLLSYSVIGLGAGMNLLVVAHVGVHGFGYTVISIACAALVGTVLGHFLKTPANTSILITVGTAICGGSAIAAVAPVLKAKSHEVSVSLGVVFMLNAAALFLFPFIGHRFGLTENQFGLWSALAIHDTSSVVGATMQYGPKALEIGTTVKLARALWIVPVTFIVGLLVARREQNSTQVQKAKRPWFILGFLAMAALVTWIPQLQEPGHWIEMVAKRMLVLTLFLIGANLNRETLKSVGIQPFLQGILLWIVIACGSLFAITQGWAG